MEPLESGQQPTEGLGFVLEAWPHEPGTVRRIKIDFRRNRRWTGEESWRRMYVFNNPHVDLHIHPSLNSRDMQGPRGTPLELTGDELQRDSDDGQGCQDCMGTSGEEDRTGTGTQHAQTRPRAEWACGLQQACSGWMIPLYHFLIPDNPDSELLFVQVEDEAVVYGWVSLRLSTGWGITRWEHRCLCVEVSSIEWTTLLSMPDFCPLGDLTVLSSFPFPSLCPMPHFHPRSLLDVVPHIRLGSHPHIRLHVPSLLHLHSFPPDIAPGMHPHCRPRP